MEHWYETPRWNTIVILTDVGWDRNEETSDMNAIESYHRANRFVINPFDANRKYLSRHGTEFKK